eukprot:1187429-Prorocentrum_minimum.AAC.4
MTYVGGPATVRGGSQGGGGECNVGTGERDSDLQEGYSPGNYWKLLETTGKSGGLGTGLEGMSPLRSADASGIEKNTTHACIQFIRDSKMHKNEGQ